MMFELQGDFTAFGEKNQAGFYDTGRFQAE